MKFGTFTYLQNTNLSVKRSVQNGGYFCDYVNFFGFLESDIQMVPEISIRDLLILFRYTRIGNKQIPVLFVEMKF